MFSLRRFISPLFIERYYIYRDIKHVAKKYNFEGNVIDVGCGEMPYKHLFNRATKYEGIDFESFSKNLDFSKNTPTHFFSADYPKTFKLPFKKECYDNTVSFQVLEHHEKPQKMIWVKLLMLKIRLGDQSHPRHLI